MADPIETSVIAGSIGAVATAAGAWAVAKIKAKSADKKTASALEEARMAAETELRHLLTEEIDKLRQENRDIRELDRAECNRLREADREACDREIQTVEDRLQGQISRVAREVKRSITPPRSFPPVRSDTVLDELDRIARYSRPKLEEEDDG